MNKIYGFLIAALLSALIFSCTKDGAGLVGADGYAGRSPTSGPGPGGGPNGGTPGVMTAGEWNDLDNWTFWNNLIQKDTIKGYPGLWGFYTQKRLSVILKDVNGKLVHNAKLTLQNGTNSFAAVTDNFGRAEFIPGLHELSFNASNFLLKANYGGVTYDLGTASLSGSVINKTLPVGKYVANTLDIQFVVDATGSMADEITYLKTELKDVITRAGSQLPGVQIRMGSVFYRDHGDDYVTRPFAFTTSVDPLISFITEQNAGGGGDHPEAVDEGLDEAINRQQWSSTAVNRLVFLILDAPPHSEAPVLNKLKAAVAAAQAKGIRIIPVSASGIDRPTEFLLRFMSIATNSTYVFITNHSGIGNNHLTPTVGNYQVEYLNNLMVRLITKYGQNND